MTIDHIFIFTNDQGSIAEKLVQFGFSEGSSRIHVGQGTANRKFYFNNFFLEILWVHNPDEINNEVIKATGLTHRAEYSINNSSPFGLCLVNSDHTTKLFKHAYEYQPAYFPEGMSIEIIKNETQPDLPWTFQLPFKGQKSHDNEPTIHRNGIEYLTKAIFEYKNSTNANFQQHFESVNAIEFKKTSRNWLTLIFDEGHQKNNESFPELQLTIQY